MSKIYVLYCPLAANKSGENNARNMQLPEDADIEYVSVLDVDYQEFFQKIDPEDKVILVGGDGTLNKFANNTDGLELDHEVFYYAGGSGNDFLNDLNKKVGCEPISLNQYLKDLPKVEVNGVTYRFLNNVGFGIDGYCCEEGDRIRAASDKPINYTAIAIKGLLYKFKPANAAITVDGETIKVRKCWLAPTMNGRYYGGGMMAAPGQDRLDKDGMLTMVTMGGKGKLKTLMMFPSIFKGEHVKYEAVKIMKGKDITVEFDRPCALQIDGETILNVTKYHAWSVK